MGELFGTMRGGGALRALAVLLAVGCSDSGMIGSSPDSDDDGEPGRDGASAPGSGPESTPTDGGGELPMGVGITETDACYDAQQSFEWELYGPVFQRCIGCHNDFGLARQQGVALRLRFPGDASYVEHNVELLTGYAMADVETAEAGTLPMLLAKPTAQVAHVGGQVLDPGGPEAMLLASYIEKLRDPPSCADPSADVAAEALESLTLASPRVTYARARFALTGEVTQPEELDALDDTEEMLDQKLDELLESDGFLERVQEMYADWLQTDAYSSLVRGDELLNQLRSFDNRDYYLRECTPERNFNCCTPAEEACCITDAEDPAQCEEVFNTLAIDAVAREPMKLVEYLVDNDLPMTELLTANYGLVNPYSATIYGLTEGQKTELFDDDPTNDADEFRVVSMVRTTLSSFGSGEQPGYPHAGVLTMPATLIRYPSSTSNQQRTRAARVVLERMLAIPVMKLADFSTATLPDDADLELATQEYPACTVCHAAIDPIAAHFKDFGGQGDYRPNRRIRDDHLPEASFLGLSAPPEVPGDPTAWLGTQVAQHERFTLGVLLPVFADLIGAEVLTPPRDFSAPDYREQYLAYRMQQIEIERLRLQFAGPFGLRVKPLVKAVIQGVFYRAEGGPEFDAQTASALATAGVGRGALLTPEQLARKLESTTGFTYRRRLQPDGRDMFRSFREYRMMFGGTDWDSTPARYREPNAMAIRVAARMGNEMACLAVPQDFAVADPTARRLFRDVNWDYAPDAGQEAEIRTQIRRLHRLIVGEVAQDDPELDATYQLWTQVRDAVASDRSWGRNCDADASYTPEETPYPTATHNAIDADEPNVRAWMAVVAYLLSDGRFFLQ